MPLTTTPKILAAWCAIALVLALALWSLAPVLSPFVVAAVLAYALSPLVAGLAGMRVPRVLAVLTVELLTLLVLASLLLLMVPILAKELPQMRDQLPLLMERVNRSIQPLAQQWGVPFTLDGTVLKAMVMKVFSSNGEEAVLSALASLKLGGSLVLALVGNVVLVPVVLFYLLMDWPRLIAQLRQLIPQRLQPWAHAFLGEVDWVLGQYLRGQLLVMLALALYYSAGLALFGLELALPIGIFTGLAVFVPYVGFGLGLVLATLAGVLQFAADGTLVHAFSMVAVVYGLGQVLEGFVLTPRLVGERIGLHPLAVIFALLAFGQLFGFVGVLVALPASAVVLVALRRLRTRYLASGLYRA